jgi:hypothetical protein
VLLAAAGLVVVAMGVVVFLIVGGNNDDDGGVSSGVVREKTPTQSTSGTAGGPDEVYRLKPNQVSITLPELPPTYEVDELNTFAQTVSTFASSYWFTSEPEGQNYALEWRILDGFQVWYQPRGEQAEAIQGAPYLRVETYLFYDQPGAKKAFDHLNALMKRTRGSEPVEARPLANDWGAYRFYEGTVGPSDVLAVYHRYIFRRGNYVVSVQTWGADPFMNIDPARNIAAAIDEKLLGTRPAVEPTAIPTPSFPGLGQ